MRSWFPDFRALWDRVLREHASPARVGFAVGIGVLVGCSPFLGLQVAIAALLAIVFRLNKLAVFLGLQISAPPSCLSSSLWARSSESFSGTATFFR